jgi:hypothetical protein
MKRYERRDTKGPAMFRMRRGDCIFSVCRALACLLLVSGAGLFVQPSAALGTQAPQSNPNPPPAYKALRYEEEDSYLKDPSRRTAFWDPLKCIPLGSWGGWYLSLGGEICVFHAIPATDSIANRFMATFGDLHVGVP